MRTRTCHLVRQATRTTAIGPHEDRIVAGDASRSGFGPTKFGRRHALPADECTAEIPETVVAEQERDFLQAELARLHALDRQRVAHVFEYLAIRRSVVGQSPEQGARQRGDRYAECAGVGIDAGNILSFSVCGKRSVLYAGTCGRPSFRQSRVAHTARQRSAHQCSHFITIVANTTIAAQRILPAPLSVPAKLTGLPSRGRFMQRKRTRLRA